MTQSHRDRGSQRHREKKLHVESIVIRPINGDSERDKKRDWDREPEIQR